MTDFIIHLVSNVSPNLFPFNDPAKFSTLLAHEIHLDDDNWEVAVREIMYPTHVATTGKDDKIFVHKYSEYYRNLLPYPQRYAESVESLGTGIDFKDVKNASMENIDDKSLTKESHSKKLDRISNSIVNLVNTSKWSKDKKILEMSCNDKYNFLLEIHESNILVLLNDALKRSLGFKNNCYMKGLHWSESTLQLEKLSTGMDPYMYLLDLETLETRNYPLHNTINLASHHRFFEGVFDYEFHDTIPDDYYETPMFQFTVDPQKGLIKMEPLLEIPRQYKKHQKILAFIRFDETTTKTFGLNPIYEAYKGNTIRFPVVSKEKLKSLTSINVQLLYAAVRELNHDLIEEPAAVISVNTPKEIIEARDLLPALNTKIKAYKNAYKFSFDSDRKRFELKVSENYVVKMSNSLSSILGYDMESYEVFSNGTHMAADFPILNRGITALYVYCNIIDSVFIGNVKAPLLLTCPFKKLGKQDFVNQVEFLNPSYIALNRKNLQQIDIAIYDDSGSLVPFLHGKTKVTLHFRKRQA